MKSSISFVLAVPDNVLLSSAAVWIPPLLAAVFLSSVALVINKLVEKVDEKEGPRCFRGRGGSRG